MNMFLVFIIKSEWEKVVTIRLLIKTEIIF
jgi:hypothetical protein